MLFKYLAYSGKFKLVHVELECHPWEMGEKLERHMELRCNADIPVFIFYFLMHGGSIGYRKPHNWRGK